MPIAATRAAHAQRPFANSRNGCPPNTLSFFDSTGFAPEGRGTRSGIVAERRSGAWAARTRRARRVSAGVQTCAQRRAHASAMLAQLQLGHGACPHRQPALCRGAARAGCSLRFTENFTRRRERRHAVAAPDRPTTAGRRYVVCTRCSPAMRGPRQALPCARGWCVARLLPRAPATLSNGPSSAARASIGLSSVDSLTRRPMSSFPSRTYPCPFSGA